SRSSTAAYSSASRSGVIRLRRGAVVSVIPSTSPFRSTVRTTRFRTREDDTPPLKGTKPFRTCPASRASRTHVPASADLPRYTPRKSMGRVTYLRLPHLSGDLLCFVAEDDLWIAPLDRPGRAWRLTVDRTKLGHPRFSPDGRHIAYTSWHSLDPEVHVIPVDGGPGTRLTYWGSDDTRVCGWEPPDEHGNAEFLAVASHGEPFSYFTWAYKLPCDGSPGRKLPWGPVSDIQTAEIDGERKSLLLTGTPPHEPASWKRYRGGATGRLWLHGRRLLDGIDGHLHSPMFVAGRIAFLSDHEGVGNLYSCAHDGTDLRRHTDHDAFYARHASSDGTRAGAPGPLWLHGRRLPDGIAAPLHSPMFVAARIAFLSDHEGVGNLYSCAHAGTDLRRHTDHDAFYARHASSDGTRVVYQCA